MGKCPFFGLCGGCKYDFTAQNYHSEKLKLIEDLPITKEPFWTESGTRRRADFAFADGDFGFYEKGSKKIISIDNCPLLMPEINGLLSKLARLPWCGAGACLVTLCDNGIDVVVTSNTPYFSTELKKAVLSLPVIRFTWNGKPVKQTETPVISFDDRKVEYPAGAFLQPTMQSEKELRDMVVNAAKGYHKIADLFCGLGNFTFVLNATGFDIVGTGIKRDLFKSPLTVGMLQQYDCVVMDPPRAGALAQCKELVKSNVKRIIYVSCSPDTFKRDMAILLRGGYELKELRPVDQFVGSSHWELFSVFQKK